MRTLLAFLILACTVAFISAGLDKDNPQHRGWSNKLDNKFGGGPIYEKAVRPVIHGGYHAGRYVSSRNPEEWARSKDQFSKVGTGQQRTDYLKAHREQKKNE